MVRSHFAVFEQVGKFTMRNKYYRVNVAPWGNVYYIVNLRGVNLLCGKVYSMTLAHHDQSMIYLSMVHYGRFRNSLAGLL